MKEHIQHLNQLTQLNAIASHENEMTSYLKSNLKGSLSTDRLGSVIASQGQGKSILITAPVDEVGMIVSYITSNGLLKVQPVGSLPLKNILHQRFIITSKDKTFHAISLAKDDTNQTKDIPKDFNKVYLDTGFKTQKEVIQAGIQIGDMVTRYSKPLIIQNDRYVAKALDGRASAYALYALTNQLDKLKVQLNAAFTVQHKMHMKGAKTASYKTSPDIAINLTTHDVDLNGDDSSVKLGHGPVIYFYDKGLIGHIGLRTYIEKISKQYNIPVQLTHQLDEIGEGHYLQFAHIGAATLSLALPIAHKNSHQETVNLKDIDNLIKLLKHFVESLNDQIVDNLLYD